MHYLLFFGIFGLPVVVCAGMFVSRFLDNFSSGEARRSGVNGTSGLPESDAHVSTLVETFFAGHIEQDQKK